MYFSYCNLLYTINNNDECVARARLDGLNPHLCRANALARVNIARAGKGYYMSKDSQEKRILIVDDDKNVTIPFQKIFQNSGVSVEIASTGQQALEKTEKSDYDLLLIDINLSDIRGYDVIKTIREKNSDINICVITSDPHFSDAIDAIDLGIDEILLKPIEIDEIKQVTERLLNLID